MSWEGGGGEDWIIIVQSCGRFLLMAFIARSDCSASVCDTLLEFSERQPFLFFAQHNLVSKTNCIENACVGDVTNQGIFVMVSIIACQILAWKPAIMCIIVLVKQIIFSIPMLLYISMFWIFFNFVLKVKLGFCVKCFWSGFFPFFNVY